MRRAEEGITDNSDRETARNLAWAGVGIIICPLVLWLGSLHGYYSGRTSRSLLIVGVVALAGVGGWKSGVYRHLPKSLLILAIVSGCLGTMRGYNQEAHSRVLTDAKYAVLANYLEDYCGPFGLPPCGKRINPWVFDLGTRETCVPLIALCWLQNTFPDSRRLE